MIERVVENWLDSASEKTYQIPFCYMLSEQGHKILHLSRHCAMEHGKDIITLDKNGDVCVFQLKGAPKSKIKLRQWQKDLIGQVTQMVVSPASHPSIPKNYKKHHKSFLVTNGEIEEEVSIAIDTFNKGWELRGKPEYHLQTIVRGELVKMAKQLKTNLASAN